MFLPDNLVQSLSTFFNQRPAESCPTMYKLLLVTLVSPDLKLENFKTLLSEISEVLPCILRQEADLLKSSTVFKNCGSGVSFEVPTPSCPDRKTYLSEFLKKIERQQVGEGHSERPLLLKALQK